VGFFDFGFDVSANAADLPALDAAWNEFGFTTIQTLFTQQGRFAGSESSGNSQFDNQKIYFRIFKTTGNDQPASDFSNVTAHGIYSSASANWFFPSQGAIPPANTTSVNSSEVTQAFAGSFDANHLFLAPIPEPSTVALFAIGFGSFLLVALKRRSGI